MFEIRCLKCGFRYTISEKSNANNVLVGKQGMSNEWEDVDIKLICTKCGNLFNKNDMII